MTTPSAQPDLAQKGQDATLPSPPLVCRVGVGVLGAMAALSALPWAWFATSHFGGFDWGFFGFEILTILAGVFAVLLGMGRFREGWALGVTSIAGSLLVALVFGLYVDFIMAKQTDYPDLYPLAKYTLLGRAGIIAVFFVLASLAVFVRNRASIGFVVKSALCVAPVLIVGALMHYNLGPGAWINTSLATASGTGALQAVLTLVLGIMGIILLSASGHLLIRAYEAGRSVDPKSE